MPPPPPNNFGGSSKKKVSKSIGQSFTLESAQKVWKSFADNYSSNGKSKFASILLNEATISLDSQLNVIVDITNSIQNDHLAIVRSDLLRQLRTDLKNETIEISTRIVQLENSNEPKKMYSAQDKFNYLQEKYPALKTLRQKLGLDFD
ncbi:hypothetical protein [Flammeovirga kamogawensis]|uniref:DNA polymerase III subunit gamma/tau n=1 Tax=Flammeovirga kamogawensis TaxID=373891 RepID=A0ABX8GW57_9BACT|nr:hypothetical protein [Flammeovirga kamogawensis]MBB6461281.1 hypothetical protein [Flammeovirga kamogawensis]QWG07840.1 hypothetical protein KM029_02545 [Flammeovirga kamogawensis]TRX69645.1 hypothetical protein EO216_16480 [Flammeovirga kamogawensis]